MIEKENMFFCLDCGWCHSGAFKSSLIESVCSSHYYITQIYNFIVHMMSWFYHRNINYKETVVNNTGACGCMCWGVILQPEAVVVNVFNDLNKASSVEL